MSKRDCRIWSHNEYQACDEFGKKPPKSVLEKWGKEESVWILGNVKCTSTAYRQLGLIGTVEVNWDTGLEPGETQTKCLSRCTIHLHCPKPPRASDGTSLRYCYVSIVDVLNVGFSHTDCLKFCLSLENQAGYTLFSYKHTLFLG